MILRQTYALALMRFTHLRVGTYSLHLSISPSLHLSISHTRTEKDPAKLAAAKARVATSKKGGPW